MAAHSILQHDADLKIFLESEAFNVDVKNKENKEPDLGQTKGVLSSLGLSVGGGGSKFVEHDDVSCAADAKRPQLSCGRCAPTASVCVKLTGIGSGSTNERSTLTRWRTN